VNVQLEAALSLRPRDAARADAALATAKRLATEALSEVRRSVAALPPAPLEALPLDAAVQRLVAEWGCSGGPEVTLNVIGEPRRCSPEVGLVVYRALQEGLTNVRKHAAAGHVWVTLQAGPRATELRIRDDGVGIGAASSGRDGGRGLDGLRERAAVLGGSLQAAAAPGGGTELALTLPTAAGVP
jgi:signal transduction histidine kinase